MTEEEIQAEAERRYPDPERRMINSEQIDHSIFAANNRRIFIAGCNFATSRHEEEMKEAVELLGAIRVGDHDLWKKIDQFLNRVKPKQ